jgi:hypothetical protein
MGTIPKEAIPSWQVLTLSGLPHVRVVEMVIIYSGQDSIFADPSMRMDMPVT